MIYIYIYIYHLEEGGDVRLLLPRKIFNNIYIINIVWELSIRKYAYYHLEEGAYVDGLRVFCCPGKYHIKYWFDQISY